jgi:hypothetical protein
MVDLLVIDLVMDDTQSWCLNDVLPLDIEILSIFCF